MPQMRSIIQDMRGGIGNISRRSFDVRLPSYHHRSRSHSCVAVAAVDENNCKSKEVLQEGCWANIPDELMRLIIEKIEESEISWPSRRHVVACAGVCRTWREITKDIVKPPLQSGCLTFPISLKQPGPKDLAVQCFIKQDRTASAYYLYLGLNSTNVENAKFLLAARKFRRATSTDYIISFDAEDMSRGSNTYIGKLRSNFLGTKFTIYDSQPPHNGVAATSRAGRRLGSKQVSSRVPSSSFNVAHIVYELNVLGSRGPRRMLCTMHSIPASAVEPGMGSSASNGIPSSTLVESLASFPSFGSKSGMTEGSSLSGSLTSGTSKDVPLILKNKAPRWHEQLQCWCLNFRGRVTVASVKNFQLVAATEPTQATPQSDQDKVILQFGKVGRDMFTMDYRYPLSAFQAFAICLSSFDTKLACE
uniref:Tubby-like F-box protein n=1 Tax=Wollemia nobilis TaxID=56998 RepID=A0A0C9QSS2_9CONI